MSLVGHSIQIWNHSGLDHKREITLHSDFTFFFFYVGKLFNEPILDNEIWNMEYVKNHQGCETIKNAIFMSLRVVLDFYSEDSVKEGSELQSGEELNALTKILKPSRSKH